MCVYGCAGRHIGAQSKIEKIFRLFSSPFYIVRSHRFRNHTVFHNLHYKLPNSLFSLGQSSFFRFSPSSTFRIVQEKRKRIEDGWKSFGFTSTSKRSKVYPKISRLIVPKSTSRVRLQLECGDFQFSTDRRIFNQNISILGVSS